MRGALDLSQLDDLLADAFDMASVAVPNGTDNEKAGAVAAMLAAPLSMAIRPENQERLRLLALHLAAVLGPAPSLTVTQ